MSLVSDIRDDVDQILSLRDQIGAVKTPVYIMTRVWADKKGVGNFVDTFVQVLPSPRIVTFEHSSRIREGGTIQQGDILLKGIAQNLYPTRETVDCSVDSDKLERWYWMNGWLYEVKSAEQKYVTWNVLITKTSKNRVEMPG